MLNQLNLRLAGDWRRDQADRHLRGTLVAALLGGKAGERYHHKVDRVGYPN